MIFFRKDLELLVTKKSLSGREPTKRGGADVLREAIKTHWEERKGPRGLAGVLLSCDGSLRIAVSVILLKLAFVSLRSQQVRPTRKWA